MKITAHASSAMAMTELVLSTSLRALRLIGKICRFPFGGCLVGFAVLTRLCCSQVDAGPDVPPAVIEGATDAVLPQGFTIPRSTLSPDGRFGVLVPDVGHYQDHGGNRLVDATTGGELAPILAATGMEKMNHEGIHARWSEDGKGLLWVVGGKWFPRAMVYLRVADGQVEWQRNILNLSQQEILKRVRKADPAAHAAVKNGEHGEGYPDGFTIDVDIHGDDVGLPLTFIVTLTSDPKHLNCPIGGTTSGGRIHDPLPWERKPFDAMPVEETVEARMRGLLEADGSITWTGFKAATGAWAVKRHQYLYGDDWHGALPENLAAKLRKAAPGAMAAVLEFERKHPGQHRWKIRLRSAPRATDSLAVDFLMVIDSLGGNGMNLPQDADILASLSGSLEEGGTLKWGKQVVSTGAEASRRRAAMEVDQLDPEAGRTESSRQMEPVAPEIMARMLPFKTVRTEDGRVAVTVCVEQSEGEDDRTATFDFGNSGGFLGSSTDPTNQAGFSNADNSIFAVNHQPATKSSYVHLFLRSHASGDLVYLNNINERIARLLKGKWADEATGFLRVESISGRNITFHTVDAGVSGYKYYPFTVTVSPEGAISLATPPNP